MSPDGKVLAFCSREAGNQGIWLKDMVSGKKRLLVQGDADRSAYSHLQFSPDGSTIAAWFNPGRTGAGSETRLVDIASGQWRRLADQPARLRGWSRDGRLLLGWRSGKPDDVVVIDASTGVFTSVLSDASISVQQPRLSPDGNWIIFNKGASVYVAPFHGKSPVSQR